MELAGRNKLCSRLAVEQQKLLIRCKDAGVPYETIFSERELMFMFAICRRPSVCLSSVTLVHPTQAIQIFGNVSAPCNTLVT